MDIIHKSAPTYQMEDVGTVFKSGNRFIWAIPNCFPFYHSEASDESTPRIISSPCFFTFCTKWRLALVKNTYENFEFEEPSMGLFLWNSSSEKSYSSPQLTVKLGLITIDLLDDLSIEGDINSYGCFGKWQFQNREEFLENSTNYTTDGYLRYFCQMRPKTESTYEDPLASTKDDTPKPDLKGIEKLSQDLKLMLSEEIVSDLVFRVKDNCEFRAHKNILAVRAPQLAPLSQNEDPTSTASIVEIPECPAAVFEILLTYVYTGRIGSLSFDNVFDLYSVANNYEITDLKTECVEFMKRNLTKENFCKMMTFSLENGESMLQNVATNFFRENADTIIKTEQWQEYVINHPLQANDLYIKAINA